MAGIVETQHFKEKTAFEKAQNGILFEENGLWGLKNEDGSILHPPQYLFIGKCIDNVLLIKPDWSYEKLWSGSTEKSVLDEDERPYIVNGKAGFMVDGKIVIPAEYDYLAPYFGSKGGQVFLAAKGGRNMYLDEAGREVLTRVRLFPDEKLKNSPFWLTTDDFDYITAMSYVGKPQDDNPNVVNIYGSWVELDRYCKDEILQKLINPADDLALTKGNLQLMLSDFSYEYSFYFANAQGKNPIQKCREQLQKMDAFYNSWYYVVKIWLAPGEQLNAKELREFASFLSKTENGTLGTPLYAVGHSDALQPGEVRMLMVTHYHERCWPPKFEYEWSGKLNNYPICKLKEELSWLKKEIEENIEEEFRDEVFHDQLLDCILDLKYYKEQSWEQARKALDFFYELGSPVSHSLLRFLEKAQRYKAKNWKNDQAASFYLNAALWAFEKGGMANETHKRRSPLDILNILMEKEWDEKEIFKLKILREQLLQKGAKTYRELKDEHESNTDYFKELEYLRVDGTTEKVMPSLSMFGSSKV